MKDLLVYLCFVDSLVPGQEYLLNESTKAILIPNLQYGLVGTKDLNELSGYLEIQGLLTHNEQEYLFTGVKGGHNLFKEAIEEKFRLDLTEVPLECCFKEMQKQQEVIAYSSIPHLERFQPQIPESEAGRLLTQFKTSQLLFIDSLYKNKDDLRQLIVTRAVG